RDPYAFIENIDATSANGDLIVAVNENTKILSRIESLLERLVENSKKSIENQKEIISFLSIRKIVNPVVGDLDSDVTMLTTLILVDECLNDPRWSNLKYADASLLCRDLTKDLASKHFELLCCNLTPISFWGLSYFGTQAVPNFDACLTICLSRLGTNPRSAPDLL
uniref:Uncharacterized protein n=1 Tax=Romanomermis culicivorax TaxID=13658 RepID=A0A915KDR2_ROMCU